MAIPLIVTTRLDDSTENVHSVSFMLPRFLKKYISADFAPEKSFFSCINDQLFAFFKNYVFLTKLLAKYLVFPKAFLANYQVFPKAFLANYLVFPKVLLFGKDICLNPT